MRRVLRHTAEVMHFWANQVQPEGRAGNVFFNGDKVYSYGSHFCIGRVLPGGAVAFTTRSYSVSTSRHQHAAESAARHLRSVYCRDPAGRAHANMIHAFNEAARLLSKATKKGIWQTTRVRLRDQALHLAEQANAYLAALPEDERAGVLPIDTRGLEQVRDELRRANEERERQRQAAAKERLVELRVDLQKWRRHELAYSDGLSMLPCALRLSEDRSKVQTSGGANIPVSFCPRLWRSVQAARAQGVEYRPEVSPHVGRYWLTVINADGSIVVGCHNIPYSELEGIAVELGYIQQEVPA